MTKVRIMSNGVERKDNMKNKKIIVIVFAIIVVISCLIICCHCIYKFIDNHKMLEQDDVVGIFDIDKQHFENVKNSMSDFSYDWDISKNKELGSEWKVCALKDNLYLGIRRQENFHQLDVMKRTIEKEESIKYVLKELGFKDIGYRYTFDTEYIDFTKQASLGNIAGVLYCVKGNPKSHPYAHKTVDLGDGWYYYETRSGDSY